MLVALKHSYGNMEIKVIQDSGRSTIWFDTISVKNVRAGVVFGRSLQATPEYMLLNCFSIQVDDGFQRTTGDWRVNQRFPSGLKSLARMIQESGFIPGIWLALLENYRRN